MQTQKNIKVHMNLPKIFYILAFSTHIHNFDEVEWNEARSFYFKRKGRNI